MDFPFENYRLYRETPISMKDDRIKQFRVATLEDNISM